MSDINLLRYFMNRKQYVSTVNALPKEMFDIDTTNMLKWYRKYFSSYKDDANINVDKLTTLMKLDRGTDSKTFALTNQI